MTVFGLPSASRSSSFWHRRIPSPRPTPLTLVELITRSVFFYPLFHFTPLTMRYAGISPHDKRHGSKARSTGQARLQPQASRRRGQNYEVVCRPFRGVHLRSLLEQRPSSALRVSRPSDSSRVLRHSPFQHGTSSCPRLRSVCWYVPPHVTRLLFTLSRTSLTLLSSQRRHRLLRLHRQRTPPRRTRRRRG